MALKEKIIEDMKHAMKAGDDVRRETLRMALSAIKNRELEKGSLTDDDVVDILRKENKKREDAAQMFLANGRRELAEKEKKEIDILNVYLPRLMSEEDVRTMVIKIIASLPKRDMGSAMKAVMAELRGKADSSIISQCVKEALSA